MLAQPTAEATTEARGFGDPEANSLSRLPFGRCSLLSRASTAELAATDRARVELEEVNFAAGERTNRWRSRIGEAFQWGTVVPGNFGDRQFYYRIFDAGTIARW